MVMEGGMGTGDEQTKNDKDSTHEYSKNLRL